MNTLRKAGPLSDLDHFIQTARLFIFFSFCLNLQFGKIKATPSVLTYLIKVRHVVKYPESLLIATGKI